MEPIHYIYRESIDSTNNELKRMAETGCLDKTVVSAGQQTAGRGRSGHVWQSPPHTTISTSMLLYPKVHMENVSRLTLIAAMAVCDAIEELYPLQTKIKWPNDILLGKKKICGILTEMRAEKKAISYVIVGIGVNVHCLEFPQEIQKMATSLDLELARQKKTGIVTSRQQLTEGIWSHFLQYYTQFEKTEDLQMLVEVYNQRLINKDQTVRMVDPQKTYTATALGIDKTGALLVNDGQTIQAITSGEVSVRGIYGYV